MSDYAFVAFTQLAGCKCILFSMLKRTDLCMYAAVSVSLCMRVSSLYGMQTLKITNFANNITTVAYAFHNFYQRLFVHKH